MHKSLEDSIEGEELRMPSDEEEKREIEFEESNSWRYILKRIDKNVLKIPELNLGHIISKQKKKLYPYNLDGNGQIVQTKLIEDTDAMNESSN